MISASPSSEKKEVQYKVATRLEDPILDAMRQKAHDSDPGVWVQCCNPKCEKMMSKYDPQTGMIFFQRIIETKSEKEKQACTPVRVHFCDSRCMCYPNSPCTGCYTCGKSIPEENLKSNAFSLLIDKSKIYMTYLCCSAKCHDSAKNKYRSNNNTDLTHECGYCRTKGPGMKNCPCKNAYYCTVTCQNNDWKNHKVSCTYVRKP